MATSTFAAAPSNASDALFRAWGSALSTAIQAVGLTKVTCDTQVNWATVTVPSAGTYAYEVYCFSDSHQATHPIYIKVGYGTSAGGSAVCSMRISVGRGVDTSDGTLTTPASTAMIGNALSSGNSATTYDCYVSGSTDRLNVIMFTGHAHRMAFFIERTKNDNGATTDDAADICMFGSSTNLKHQQLPKSGNAYPATPGTPMCAVPTAGAGSWGDNVGLFPIFPNMGYAANPTMGGCIYFTADIASGGTSIELTFYGVSHTFICAGVDNATAINGNSGVKSIAVRYE